MGCEPSACFLSGLSAVGASVNGSMIFSGLLPLCDEDCWWLGTGVCEGMICGRASIIIPKAGNERRLELMVGADVGCDIIGAYEPLPILTTDPASENAGWWRKELEGALAAACFRRIIQKAARAALAITIKPPITPPTIAPIFVDLWPGAVPPLLLPPTKSGLFSSAICCAWNALKVCPSHAVTGSACAHAGIATPSGSVMFEGKKVSDKNPAHCAE